MKRKKFFLRDNKHSLQIWWRRNERKQIINVITTASHHQRPQRLYDSQFNAPEWKEENIILSDSTRAFDVYAQHLRTQSLASISICSPK